MSAYSTRYMTTREPTNKDATDALPTANVFDQVLFVLTRRLLLFMSGVDNSNRMRVLGERAGGVLGPQTREAFARVLSSPRWVRQFVAEAHRTGRLEALSAAVREYPRRVTQVRPNTREEIAPDVDVAIMHYALVALIAGAGHYETLLAAVEECEQEAEVHPAGAARPGATPGRRSPVDASPVDAALVMVSVHGVMVPEMVFEEGTRDGWEPADYVRYDEMARQRTVSTRNGNAILGGIRAIRLQLDAWGGLPGRPVFGQSLGNLEVLANHINQELLYMGMGVVFGYGIRPTHVAVVHGAMYLTTAEWNFRRLLTEHDGLSEAGAVFFFAGPAIENADDRDEILEAMGRYGLHREINRSGPGEALGLRPITSVDEYFAARQPPLE